MLSQSSKTYEILDRIDSPEDLKKIKFNHLNQLCEELRDFIISTVSQTGGHLAPNLGVVELTVALHRVFNSPVDKLIWDVGHQAYIHKILTGRRQQFSTLRQYGGISGFPKISESPHDIFGVGHASTSISAALGMAAARDLKGEKNKIVAIIGDGSLSGGIALEGLNHAGWAKRDLIVILNDNCMSISANVGALSRYLTSLISNPVYNKIKDDIWKLTGKLPMGSRHVRNSVRKLEEAIKSMLVPGLLFERLGFRYFGPIDGHDLSHLTHVLRDVRRLHGPILVHVITKKGKGYTFAENDATKFHGLGSFCKETGSTPAKKAPSYTEVFGKTLVELAEKDKRIVGITAAMADGTGLSYLSKALPERFFDVGIAEQHAVTFACGLAKEGYRPVAAIYSTFMQRAFDQVIHDAALQNLPVVFAMDRGGLVGEDGPTHHGAFDLSFMRLVPNLICMAPKDENELRHMLYTALNYEKGPSALRFPRGEGLGLTPDKELSLIPIGKGELLREGKDLAIIAVGDRVYPALSLAETLEKSGVRCRVVNARFIKPLDEELIEESARTCKALITLEHNSKIGGFGGGVAEFLSESGIKRIKFRRFGLPDRFITYGCVPVLLKEIRLDQDALAEDILNWL